MTGPIVQPPYVLGGVNVAPPVNTGWNIPAGEERQHLDDLIDVDTTGQASGDVLTYDGTEWVPEPPAPSPVLGFHRVVETPTTLVQIVHGLPFQPAGLTINDSQGDPFEPAKVSYPGAGVLELRFGVPFTGEVWGS